MALSNFYWDSAKPVDGTLIPDGPQAWRYVVGNNAALLGIEHHTFPTDSNSGAYHQPGSAVLLTGTTRPLTRLDTTAFDVNDNGRLFYDTDVETLEVLTAFGGPTWVSFGSLSAAHTWALAQTFSVAPTFTAGVVANNTALSARNAADDGNVEMIRVDGSGVVTLPDGVVATTQSADDNSTLLATTAYVDNNHPAYTGGESHTDGSGLITKMGNIAASSAAVDVDFAVAFPGGITAAIITIVDSSGSALNFPTMLTVRTTAKLTIKNVEYASIDSYDWIAIGY